MDTPREQIDDEARRLLAARQKIEAIRFVRRQTGIGLAEAKAYVDALETGADPVAAVTARGARRAGCVPALVLIALALLLLGWALTRH